jgi:hypothetical protein
MQGTEEVRLCNPLVLRRREAASKDAPIAAGVEGWSMLRDTALSPGSSARGSRAVAVGNDSCTLRLERACWVEPGLDRRPDGGGDVVFASVGVDDDAAPRLGRGDVEERPPQDVVKRQPL